MIKKLSTVALMIASLASYTQTDTTQTDTTYWRLGGVSSLTFSQVSLTNWVAGGQNSVAVNSNFNAFANRIKGRTKWESSLSLAYGLIKQGSAGFSKSDDLINMVTKYSYQMSEASEKWFFTGSIDFRTQFTEGFETPEEIVRISDFMAPGYLTFGIGVSFDPSEKLSFSYQPVTGKITIVNDQELADQGAYGVDPGDNVRAEFGSFFRAKYKNEIFESKLELFTGYTESQGEIDLNWQNALVFNLTKVLSMNAFTHMIYDKDILIGVDDNGDGVVDETELKPRLQFKSVLGVGLAYKFGE